MKEEKNVVEQGFYQACADLLGVDCNYRPFLYRRPDRWNNRSPGNGRFEGFGLVRLFGDRVHMALRKPRPVNRWFSSRGEALEFLSRTAGARAL